MQKVRQSNFELLRILAMLMIVAHHFALHSHFLFAGETSRLNTIWWNILLLLGKVGVDVFVLISGYFMVRSESLKVAKVLRFWGELAFYSIGCYVAFWIAGQEAFSVTGAVKAILPVLSNSWWFAGTYFVLFLFSPFLNRMLRALTQKQYKIMLGIMFALWSLGTLVQLPGVNYSSLVWFVFLYSLAGYLQLYGDNIHVKPVFAFGMACIGVVVTVAGCLVSGRLAALVPLLGAVSTTIYEMQSPFVLLIAVALFLGFREINMPVCRPVNRIASTTFGIYLLHDCNYTRSFLWERFLHCADYGNSRLFIPYSIAVILGVFVACMVVDLLRQFTVERLYMGLVHKCIAAVQTRKKH